MIFIDKSKLYIANLQKKKNAFIVEMEKFAAENHVPIMDSDAIETFLGLLSIQRPTHVLEIGSAIGYSAIRMAQSLSNVKIVTIERESERFMKAVEFINEAGLEERIQIIEADALEYIGEAVFSKTFDALFIDAAKGQYKRFFKKYSPTIASKGVIYCDNMFMHGMVFQEVADLPRRKRTMIRNLQQFTSWVMAHPDFDTTLLPVGDGILIAVKK